MKFLKGMLVGGMVATGIAMMCTDSMERGKRKMMRQGRRMAKRMGMM